MKYENAEKSAIAWVLLAIWFGGGEQGATTESIISAADYVNHAILEYSEYKKGSACLYRRGIIFRRNNKIFLDAEICRRYLRPKRHDVRSSWRICDRILRDRSGHPDVSFHPQSIENEKEYERKVQAYLSRNDGR